MRTRDSVLLSVLIVMLGKVVDRILDFTAVEVLGVSVEWWAITIVIIVCIALLFRNGRKDNIKYEAQQARTEEWQKAVQILLQRRNPPDPIPPSTASFGGLSSRPPKPPPPPKKKTVWQRILGFLGLTGD